ncbi:hypothetical protein, partial [Neobacillus vireti]|uniref:hypothetical protein n=1 Tax=Neobacillus vireti TaxID=220686 RepID=UPI003000F0DA
VLTYIYFLWKPDIDHRLIITFCFLLSLVISCFLYHFFEEPMRIKLKEVFNLRLINNHVLGIGKKKLI